MITLENGHIQNASSIFVPYGSISFSLNVDATVIAAPGGFVCADIPIVFQLDANGNLIQPCQIWSNEELQPQLSSTLLGTYYRVQIQDRNGAALSQPMWWQFPEAANSVVDISQMTPVSTVGGVVIFYPTSFGGSGTVTSVTFTGDGTVLSATPSAPVTTSGTIAATLLTQNALTFLAGPVTPGPAASPTFRHLVVADLNLATAVNSTLFVLNSTHAGPASHLDDVLELTNTAGLNATPTYFTKDESDNFLITTGIASLELDALGTINIRAGGSLHPSLLMQVGGSIALTGINTGAITFLEGTTGYSTGVNQIQFSMNQTGTGPHGVWMVNGDGRQGQFLNTDAGDVILTSLVGQNDALTQVSVSGGTTTYTGTFPTGGSNQLAGQTAAISGFSNGGNNVVIAIASSTGTIITCTTSTQVNESALATAIINYNSPKLTLTGSTWNGSAFVDSLTIFQDIAGSGSTPTVITQISNSGASTWGGVSIIGPVKSQTLTITAATPTGSAGQVGFGTTAGFGAGSSGTAVTTTTKGGGTGPTTPQTVVNYLEIDIAGTKYWIPLVQ